MHDKRSWHTDSGSEATPLLSSDASRTSCGAACMFPDSETSDLDNPRSDAGLPLREKPVHYSSSRRPFHYHNGTLGSYTPALDDQISAMTYNRFQYYSKLRTYASNEEDALAIPEHVIPPSVFVPYIPGNDQESGKQSSIVTIFAVWNTIMGSSLLAMPWGIQRAGLWNGIFLMLLMGGLCLYTAYRLLDVHKKHGITFEDGEVPELSKALLGRSAEMIAKFFSLVILLGASIVYWILMSNFLYHTVDFLYEISTNGIFLAYSQNGTLPTVFCPREDDMLLNKSYSQFQEDNISKYYDLWNLNTTVPVFLTIIIAPLVNFKSSTFFTKFNSLGTLSVIYLLIFVFTKASKWGINSDLSDVASVHYVPSFLPTFPGLSGMLALSFFIHNIIITVMKSNRRQENNSRDLSIAFVLVTLTYVLIGAVFYVTFPLKKTCIEDNLLNNFENMDVMTAIARVFLFFQLVTVYPLIAYMLRVQSFSIFMKKIHPNLCHIFIFNSVIIITCVLFTIYLPRIGTIIRFTGAISGFIYIFTLPCLLHLASLHKKGQSTVKSTLLHLLIPVIGGVNLVAQFFVSDH